MEVATYEAILALLRATPATAFPYLSHIAAQHARQLLCMYLLNQMTVVEPDSVPKKAINSVFKDPSVLASLVVPDAVNVLAKELELDGLSRLYGSREELVDKLVKDVEEAVMIDCIAGPESDVARRAAGLEYEGKLYEHLKEHDIAFWTEDELRDLNYIKTPDALLKVPIAVQGRVVMWIDSKATFADAKAHQKLLRDQYSGYINRFGSGAVIYWHLYLKEGVADASPDVLCLDAFPPPEDIVKLPML